MRSFFASIASYFISENINATLLQKIKQLTNAKLLFLRFFSVRFLRRLLIVRCLFLLLSRPCSVKKFYLTCFFIKW